MRVLVVTAQYPVPERPSYGVFVAEQVRSLQASGVDVEVLFFNAKRNRLNYALSFPRIIRALASGRHDIVHTHHTYTMLLVAAARALTRRRVPVVLTNHEGEVTDPQMRTRTWHPTSRLRHSLLVKRAAARRADFLVMVSSRAAAALAVKTPHEVIPCGVDLVKFSPLSRAECRAALGIASDAVVIFFPAGPRAEGKRFQLAETTFGIVRARVPRAILLTAGNIPHDSMPLYYSAADVVLQCSYFEASPTVVKEALACEVPIVSTDSGDTREVVAGVPNCYVTGDDPEQLAAHILDCVGRRAVGGRDHLRRKGLGLEQTAQRIVRVYETILDGRVSHALGHGEGTRHVVDPPAAAVHSGAEPDP